MLLLLAGLRFYFWKHFVKLEVYSFERSSTDFLYLLLTIGLISVGGYLVNDLFDIEVDKVNKPEKKLPFSKPVLWLIYIGVNVLAIIIVLLISENSLTEIILLGTIILLFLYSFAFQKLPLIGNILVAVLAGVLPVLYLVFDSITVDFSNAVMLSDYGVNLNLQLTSVIFLYFSIGFGITLLREFVKDIEDLKGDKLSNYKTLPVLASIRMSKILFYIFSVLFIFGISILDKNLFNNFLLENWLF